MGGRAQVNKAHKTRFSSKSSRNIHKTSLKVKQQAAKSGRNVGKGAKAARRQQDKMIREQKREAVLSKRRALNSPTSPPRVIVLFGLSGDVDLDSLQSDMLSLLPGIGGDNVTPIVTIPDSNMRATVLKAPHGDLSSCMEMAKVADLIAFVASEGSPDYIDSFGAQCLSVFRTIGLPSSVVLIRDLPTGKRRHKSEKCCTSSLSSEFPEDCKFYPANTKDELHKFLRVLKDQSWASPRWRTERAYIASQKVEILDQDPVSGKCTLVLTGYLRARSLSVNQLVHVSGAGDYQLCGIEILTDPNALNPRKGQDMMDAENLQDVQVIGCLKPDGSKQEHVVVENIPDPLAGDQTWPTEKEMADAEEDQKQKKIKKKMVPPGTSEYQASWILDDSDDDLGSADEADDGMVLDEGDNGFPCNDTSNNSDFDEDQGPLDLVEFDGHTESDSVMMDPDVLTREQIEDEIKKLKDAHAEDEEYPDEVVTPVDVPARKRFAKYRGLKSFRTTSWDPKESLPLEYARIFAFDNFARTQKLVLAKASELDKNTADDTVAPGTYVRLFIKEVPNTVASTTCSRAKTAPVIASGLLQHESKMSVIHFSIRKHDSYTEPIKAKEELIFHVGFRQFVVRPVFSTDIINSDKQKMERFLHPGRFSVASVYAPITFPPRPLAPIPLVAMKSVGDGCPPVVAAVGCLKSIDPDRIILKKIILTGYPQSVSKVKATVRFMFHSPEDVRWFKPVEVWTKCGRRGRIREPVGTHGAMKCVFNGVLQQNDTVCMSLFKRAYPKWPEHRFPIFGS